MEHYERLENSGNRGCIRLSYGEFFVFGINRNSEEKGNNKEKSISTALEQNSDKSSDEKFPRYRPLE